MNVVLGVSAAPGIGIGKAFILPEEQERIIPKRKISQEEVEPEWVASRMHVMTFSLT